MATGMVTFKTEREAGTYEVLYEGGNKPEHTKKYSVEVVIADAATVGIPIAATLNAPVGAPGDLLESGDAFDFSMHDPSRGGFHHHLGGGVVVD